MILFDEKVHAHNYGIESSLLCSELIRRKKDVKKRYE